MTRFILKIAFVTLSLLIGLSCVVFSQSVIDPGEQRAHHVSTSVNFRIPKKWKKSNDEAGYPHTDALFGVPFHKGRTIQGSVFYMTPNMRLDSETSDATKNGCADYDISLNSKELSLSKIFLVDRGSCTFTEKASVAQSKGAEALIVANNECISSDIKYLTSLKLEKDRIKRICCVSYENAQDCDLDQALDYLPFMVSSGQSAALNIFIPAVMISLTDALKVKYCLCKIREELKSSMFCNNLTEYDFLKQDKNSACDIDIIMELKLDTPHPSGVVKYELWMKPDAQPTFLKSFEWFAQALHEKAVFTPQYIVHEPIKCSTGSDDEEEESMCQEYCIKIDDDENICYLPETDNFEVTGVDVLHEIIRQYCIWELDNATYTKNGLPNWWKYQEEYRKEDCINQDNLKDCSANIARSLSNDFDYAKWHKCSEDETEVKRVLRALNSQQQEKGIFTTAMMVNSRVIHFSLAPDTLAARVCDGFHDGTAPHVCICVNEAQNENEFLTCETCKDKHDCTVVKDKPASRKSIVLVLLFSTTLIAGLFIYTRQSKRRMQSDMRSILAEYMPLDEMGPGGGVSRDNFVRANIHSNVASAEGRDIDREDTNLI